MANQLDQILVVDIEATCWAGKPPQGQSREIIEIGLCILDVASRERIAKESILIKPERSTVSKFCTKLTTLTQEQVEQGLSFKEACTVLRKQYLSKRRTWASYGDFDRRQFERQCLEHKNTYPFNISHINIKNLLALMYKLPHEIGLDKAIDLLGLPFEGTPHRGIDDAWNVATILAILLDKPEIRR